MKKEGEKVIEVLEQRFLNLMVKTTVAQFVPQQPREVRNGADTHSAACD